MLGNSRRSLFSHLTLGCIVVQLLSCAQLFETPWTTVWQASLSFTISQRMLKLKSIESVMPSNQVILCHPFLLLTSIFPSIRVFSNESVLPIRWPKDWNFNISTSASVLPMNIQAWFPLGLTGLVFLQSKGLSKVFSNTTVWKHQSVLWCSAFFIVQLSHPYVSTGKTIALTIWTFVSRVMFLFFKYYLSLS